MLNSSVFYFISLKSSSPQNKHSMKSAKNSVFSQEISDQTNQDLSLRIDVTSWYSDRFQYPVLQTQTAHCPQSIQVPYQYCPVLPPAESERLSICPPPPKKSQDSRCFNRWESSQVPLAWDKHSSVPIPYQYCEVYCVLVCRLYSFLSFYYCSALDCCCQRAAVLFSFACHWVVRQ